MNSTFYQCAIFGLVYFGSTAIAEANEPLAVPIAEAPIIAGWDYRTSDLVRVVNSLRRIGKEKSLRLLWKYNESSDRDRVDRIVLVCQSLFVNKQSWRTPSLGEPVSIMQQEHIKKFPSFPLAISEGVPFLVVEGYRIGGMRAENADQLLQQCETLPIISEDLPTFKHFKAAKALFGSQGFRDLFSTQEQFEYAQEMVFNQARILK